MRKYGKTFKIKNSKSLENNLIKFDKQKLNQQRLLNDTATMMVLTTPLPTRALLTPLLSEVMFI